MILPDLVMANHLVIVILSGGGYWLLVIGQAPITNNGLAVKELASPLA
jgi:hypothetical protein